MATTVAPGEYTLVYLVYNTISNLLTQAEQVACFRNAARHLGPGGRFVIELWVPELRKLPPGRTATVWQSEPGYIGLDTYDVLRQHVVSHHFRFDDTRQAELFRSPHRYIWPAELDLMAQLAGFELESRHADWDGAAFTAGVTAHELRAGRLSVSASAVINGRIMVLCGPLVNLYRSFMPAPEACGNSSSLRRTRRRALLNFSFENY